MFFSIFFLLGLNYLICNSPNLSSTIFLCQEKIAEYIENEDRKKPYSDQDIVKLLENDGIKIARRTVSKYRIDLGYKSSSERKKY